MKKIVKLLEKVQLSIGVIMLSIFFLAVIIQVATRYLGVSVIWTGEVANYSFIWSIFMGTAVMINRKEHFKFDLLYKKLTGKMRSSLSIFNDSILFLFSLAILFYGVAATDNFWNYNWVSLPFMKMGYVWLSVPVMGLTMMIYLASHIIYDMKGFNREEANK
ncbi:C4-dicarboxylate ABC transporter permease [Salipaludibacillus neizhouensis]|uniref:C4-dicarboxylate ABC transporter permease n=1 Tax=Salipaludibacillus neizhouensis TaxID=885475 RepID=A0A3A9K045_9BACI|nr:TRAP transporter small permease [Salipaludibacillus neizhouensis]RKL66097.1 C4-dicarboxylate ABC transporter permease [Salipaludibacillus neizhouensis]